MMSSCHGVPPPFQERPLPTDVTIRLPTPSYLSAGSGLLCLSCSQAPNITFSPLFPASAGPPASSPSATLLLASPHACWSRGHAHPTCGLGGNACWGTCFRVLGILPWVTAKDGVSGTPGGKLLSLQGLLGTRGPSQPAGKSFPGQ